MKQLEHFHITSAKGIKAQTSLTIRNKELENTYNKNKVCLKMQIFGLIPFTYPVI